MPGSSGSAIYNEKGEISALVFAGQGDLGYAFAVPVEYIYAFLGTEISSLEIQYPTFAPGKSDPSEDSDKVKKIKEACQLVRSDEQKFFCEQVLKLVDNE